jgi:hypothetical protein
MPKQIELLALPDEVMAWTRSWATEHGLYAALVWIFPSFRVSAGAPRESTIWQGVVEHPPRWVLLDTEPFRDGDEEYLAFMRASNRGVSIAIGPKTEEGSRSSQISFVTSEKSAWGKKILAEVERRTGAGVRAINPMTGASDSYPAVRVSEGARKFMAEGGVMMPAAGWVRYSLLDA